jgi:undecaprenyl-diphosphatase
MTMLNDPVPARAAEPRPPAGPRPDPRPWWWAPLALLAGFALLLGQVLSHGPVTGLDIHVRDRLQGWANSPTLTWLGPIGRALADLGNLQWAGATLLVALMAATWRARSPRPALIALAAVAWLTTVILLKLWIGRPGPGALAWHHELGFFPSGHTSTASLGYGTAAILLGTWGKRSRRLAGAVAGTLVGVTILGLLWSDYHWLSDVLGALCWSGAALLGLHRLAGRPAGVD